MAGRRFAWMDSLRGVAIVFVLLWHAPAVPALLGVVMPHWLESVNDALIPFRMPLLMFLSGLLLVRSLEKPLLEYYLGKLTLIAWPYLLWAAVHNITYDAVAPLWHPRAWIATGYLWFLFFILCFYLVAPLLRRVPPLLVAPACFVLAVVVDDRLLHRMLYFAGFFFAGYLAARYQRQFHRVVDSTPTAVVCGVVAVGFAVVSSRYDVQYQAEFALLSLAGVLSLIHLARRIGDAVWTRPLQYVGRNSIVYYTTHFPLMHLALLALLALGIHSSLVIAPVMLVFAGALGTLAVVLSRRPPVRWLFVAPVTLPRRPAVTAPLGRAAGVP
ncbi:acyltransferase family protein [Desertihabitans aurantiacus]|uniref:acyltransferase family protein n=1 Tax=Desertihabitans aurantiacus TaxID=2282477 RepID=UPI000DF8036A|nr:acyltransferase family protein [Desertihabitans aurantiacus]